MFLISGSRASLRKRLRASASIMLEIAATADSIRSLTTTYSYKSIAFSSSLALVNRRIKDLASSVPLAPSRAGQGDLFG